jgi:cytochrome c2
VEWTIDALLELGRTAFDSWPAQSQPLLAQVLESPALARAIGLWSDDSGRIGGVVIERYADGSERPALTCSSCHARVEPDGRLLRGPASQLDIGALFSGGADDDRSDAGLVDVTSDAVDNAVAIPDLRATRHQRRLHWSGSLYNGLDALAVRIETLLITSSSETVRPPREIVFALALYIWSLGHDPERTGSNSAGATVFEEHCATCHEGATGEGDAINADVVGTDPAVARSTARGTGQYRVPSLHRVGSRTHLTHEGRSADLEAWLDPARAFEDAAHPFGLDLPSQDRADLIAFLKSL